MTSYPSALKSFTTWVDGVDYVAALIVNDIQGEVAAIETELGTDVAGSATDLKTRLAVEHNDDGTHAAITCTTLTTTDNITVASGKTVDGYDLSNLTTEHNADGTHAVVTATSVTMSNNQALYWKDSGGVARRIGLLTASDTIYTGDVDNNGFLHLVLGTPIIFYTSATDQGRFDSSGHFTINGTSASGQLTVNAKDASTVGLVVSNYASTMADIARFQVNGTSKVVIDKDGNVGIRTTDQFGSGAGVLALGNAATNPTTTLTNAALLYVSGGELYAYDSAGNATLLSPHNDAGEWIFYSRNTLTGKEVRVNMERMIAEIEQLTGKKFMEVSWQN